MESVPSSLEPVAFARARTAEVLLLKRDISESVFRGSRRVFQTLPRHMRRRAASFNIRRLPTRLREKALAEVRACQPGPLTIIIIIIIAGQESERGSQTTQKAALSAPAPPSCQHPAELCQAPARQALAVYASLARQARSHGDKVGISDRRAGQ